jgi:hypothetical protein
MIEHLRDCFAAYLEAKKQLLPSREAGRDTAVSVPIKTLDKAFGLTRIASGQPKVDSETHGTVAAQVLAEMLAGESETAAICTVAVDRKERGEQVSSESQVRDSWTHFKHDGLLALRIARIEDGWPNEGYWTNSEIVRLCEIYADVPGVVLPGEKAWHGRHAIPEAKDADAVE